MIQFIYYLFSPRDYARNSREPKPHYRIAMSYIIAGIGLGFFLVFPLRGLGLMVLLGFSVPALFGAITYANCAPWFAFFNVLLGAAGLYAHWVFGLTLFGYHFEWLLFWGIVFGGFLALLRRVWNAWIWGLIDYVERRRCRFDRGDV